MALTQMQLIQSLGEAMAWFERELQWGVPATELRHLSGSLGELYAALITNGQMAMAVNQHGYDVVSGIGERVSVKTTAMMGASGQIVFNPNTLNHVDRVIILRINTDEMQIETLLNETVSKARELMSKPDSNGKVCIPLARLVKTPRSASQIKAIKMVYVEPYTISELENGSIEVKMEDNLITPAKVVLRELALKANISLLNSNGNPLNTRQLGSLVIKALEAAEDRELKSDSANIHIDASL